MEPFAQNSQLVLGRPLTDQELVDSAILIDRASRLIRRNFQDVDARISAGDLTAEEVADVVCAMVERALLLKVGVRSSTEQRGPWSETATYTNATGGLYLTDDDRAVFAPRGSSGRAFTIDTMPASVVSC